MLRIDDSDRPRSSVDLKDGLPQVATGCLVVVDTENAAVGVRNQFRLVLELKCVDFRETREEA